MASRELRLLKLEADAVRRELNEWRDRAHLPRVEEPVRSEAFSMVLSGEVEILTSIPGMDEEEDGEGLDNDDDMPIRAISAGISHAIPEEAEDMNPIAVPTMKPYAPHNALHHPGASQLAHILPRPPSDTHPIIAQNISNVSFENPAMTSFDQQAHVSLQQYQMQFNVGTETEKPATWNNQMFVAQQLQQQLPNQHGLYTPPVTSHGPPPASAGQPFPTHHAYYQAPSRQHHIYGSPVDSEDGSSVTSGFGGRDRRTSLGGSTYGSPQGPRPGSVSSQPSYEVSGIMNAGIQMGTDATIWSREEMENMTTFKSNMVNAPIAVGSGNGGGYVMMM